MYLAQGHNAVPPVKLEHTSTIRTSDFHLSSDVIFIELKVLRMDGIDNMPLVPISLHYKKLATQFHFAT